MEPKTKGPNDDLGKLLTRYGGRPFPTLPIVSGLALIGGGIGAILFDGNHPEHGGVFKWLGYVLLFAGIGIPVNSFVLGRKSFEVRKRGVRHTVGSRTTELRWEEIDSIEIREAAAGDVRVDALDRGGSVVDSRSLRHHYTITIFGTGEEVITLNKSFLQLGGSPRGLIKILEANAGDKVFTADG